MLKATTSGTDEYRVKVIVKNNLLLSAIEAEGYKSVVIFCKEKGLSYSSVSNFVNLKSAPINADGEFTQSAKDLMEILGAAPNDLWTDTQLYQKLRTNYRTFSTTAEGINAALIETQIARVTAPDPYAETDKLLLKKTVDKCLATLTKIEQDVLKARFEDDLTLEETAEAIKSELYGSVTKERIRQIEVKAIRKLHHPSRLESLKQFEETSIPRGYNGIYMIFNDYVDFYGASYPLYKYSSLDESRNPIYEESLIKDAVNFITYGTPFEDNGNIDNKASRFLSLLYKLYIDSEEYPYGLKNFKEFANNIRTTYKHKVLEWLIDYNPKATEYRYIR